MPKAKNSRAENLYVVLQLTQDATADEIVRAYRQLALKYHPDRNPFGAEMFKKVNAAYATLSDPEKRCIYDATGSVGQDLDDEHEDAHHSESFANSLASFYAQYRGSKDELDDLATAYREAKGDFAKVMKRALFDNGQEKEVHRIRDAVEGLFATGALLTNNRWKETSTDEQAKRLDKKFASERAAAESELQALSGGLGSSVQPLSSRAKGQLGDDTSALQALILNRKAARNNWESMCDVLEAEAKTKHRKRTRT